MTATDQRRQRRQLGAVLAGVVALGASGVVAGAVLGDTPCDDLLPAASDAGQAGTDVPAVVAEAQPSVDALERSHQVLEAGDRLGLGPIRGAIASAPDADLVPFEDGVFAIRDDHLRIVESGLVAVATGREGDTIRRAVAVSGPELGLTRGTSDGDDLVARYDEDLRLGDCRALDEPGTVVHLDAGVAIIDRGGDVEAVRLDGGSLWRAADLLSTAATDAAVTGLQAIVANADEVVAVDLRSGVENWRLDIADLVGRGGVDEAILLAGDDAVLLSTEEGMHQVSGETGEPELTTLTDAPPTAAIVVPGGVLVAAGDELVRIDDTAATTYRLPARVRRVGQTLAWLDDRLLVATQRGLASVTEPFGVAVTTLAGDLPATAIAVSDGYTAVTTDVGSGVTFLFGPVGASATTEPS